MAVAERTVRYPEGVRAALKSIRLRSQHPEHAAAIADEHRVSPLTARVLAARGFACGPALNHFLQPTLKEGLPDPEKLLNLDKACELIARTIEAGEGIAICCDFDVDGLSGGAQVYHFLQRLGVQCAVFVPDRFEDGYGLNERMIHQIAELGFKLVVTIDYGTTNRRELELARSLDLKTIVVDHHHVGEKPPSDVFINPMQPGCGFGDRILCASGLAWYLLVGLKRRLPKAAAIEPKEYLDLACLGTICDMVPLIGPNRVLAKRGLELLTRTERPGLVALKNVMSVRGPIGCSDVSFGIGPRLNAAGRMVHGELVIELLTTADSRKAAQIAQRLNKLNIERQDKETEVKEVARRMIEESGELPWGISVWDRDFHTGVIGIVAQRLVETFYRPCAVMGMDRDGLYKGSVRGIKGFSVVEALGAVRRHLVKFGGHEGAGGFSLEAEHVEEFAEAFNAECRKRLKSIETKPFVDADTVGSLEEISIPLVEELRRFAPFGMGNPNPIILVQNLEVQSIKILKEAHLKATLSDGRRSIAGLMWRHTEHPALTPGARVNVALKPDTSSWNGSTEIQGHLQAVERVS